MLEILELFPLRYVALVPVLNAIGFFLKHRTRLPNEYIPFLLFAFASVSSVTVRWMISGESGLLFWFDAVFMYGIVNSLKLTISAIGSYEAVRAIGFSGRRMEVQMFKRPVVRLFLAFITATVLFSLVALILGASFLDTFFKITDGWVYGFYFIGAFDLFSKIAKHRERITPLYIVRLASAMLAATMFCMAGMADDVGTCIAGIVLAAVLVGTSAITVLVPFIKEQKAESEEVKDFSPEKYEETWAKLRGKLQKLSPEKKAEILEGFLLFRLIGDSILNNVDFSQPLFSTTNEKGEQILLTVRAAEEMNAADEESIASARGYIKAISG